LGGRNRLSDHIVQSADVTIPPSGGNYSVTPINHLHYYYYYYYYY